MFKLMIVDDERIVQEGIKITLENAFDDIEIVGMASSGREAIEMSQQIVPDIILMDIKMPGINGIEAIEAIKARHINTKFVIISAYEQFEYAKHAVKLGVSDYILKPINRERLSEVIEKVKYEITEERNKKKRAIQNLEKLERVMPVLEKGFIYTMLMNTDFKGELKKYRDLFEIKKDKGYVMIFEFDSDITAEGNGFESNKTYSKIQDLIKYKCKCIVGPMIINRVTAVVYEDAYDHEYEQRIKALSLGETILDQMNTIISEDIKLGIGSCYPLEKIKNSLEEANYTISKVEKEKILHINDISESLNQTNDYTYVDIKADEIEIIQLMELGNQEKLADELMCFFRKVEKRFSRSQTDTKNIITELMVMVLSSSYKNNLCEEEVGYSSYISEIKRIEDLTQLENWCIRKILYIASRIHEKKNSHVSKVMIKAKQYIDENYHRDIGLNHVSKEVSISPQYFSTIFKEELGINFVEYLRVKRVEIAKKLLREKTYSVKEICYMIGYNDPNYFSRLFKKIVGVSPTEFK